MARRHRKFKVFRLIILILLIVLVIVCGIILSKKFLKLDKKEEVKVNTNVENLNDVVRISCNKYDVYFDDDNKLGFNFIIAELNFDNDSGNLFYDLNNLVSSEKTKLDQVDWHLSKLKEYNYDIKNFNLLSNQFSNESGHITGNVFIPFEKNYTEISIYNGEEIKFDLTKNKHNINELIYDIKTEDIKTEKYDITISNSYPENEFITSDTGDSASYPYALVFEIYVNKISSNNVYIESAKFIPDGASYSIPMIDDYIDSYKIKNAINKKLKVGDKYGLFFQVSESINTTGKIMIKFSDSDKWMELSTGE